MATDLAIRPQANGAAEIVERVITAGDLDKLSPAERVHYYVETCRSLGLNALTRPFEFIRLSGKLVLYARKDATDQLRAIRSVSLELTSSGAVGDLYVVTAKATLPNGRSDSEIGAVAIKGVQGEALANAMMKASTKAKRRVTLSICGLGLLDESEVGSVPDARPVRVDEDGVIHEHTPDVDAQDVARQDEEPQTDFEMPPYNELEFDALKSRCASLKDEIHAAAPALKVVLPATEDPAEWEQWLIERQAKWKVHPANPQNVKAGAL